MACERDGGLVVHEGLAVWLQRTNIRALEGAADNQVHVQYILSLSPHGRVRSEQLGPT